MSESENILKAASPLQMLAAMPIMAGHTLEDCVTIVSYVDNTSNALARLDWRAPTDLMARTILRLESLQAVMIIGYSESSSLDEIKRNKLADLANLLVMSSCRVYGVFLVGNDGIEDLGGGHRWTLDELAQAERDLGLPQPTADVVGDISPIEMHDAKRLHVLMIVARVLRERRDPREWRDELVELFEDAITRPSELDDDELAKLLLYMSRSDVRDFAILQWATSADDARSRWESWFDPDDRSEADAAVFLGHGLPPDKDRMERVQLLGRVLHGVGGPSPWSLAPLTAAGWSAWAIGNSSRATAILKQATKIADRAQQQHSELAEHICYDILTLVRSGEVPPWLYDMPILEGRN